MSQPETLRLRLYSSNDASETLAVFLDAITVTAAADYSAEQIAAWARPGSRDLSDWDQQLRDRNTVVADVLGEIAGFSDVSDDGYIDRMFVSPRFARRGVGRALLMELEQRARRSGSTRLYSNVSITARPLFERHGFRVDAEQRPVVEGVAMTNFRMSKHLTSNSTA